MIRFLTLAALAAGWLAADAPALIDETLPNGTRLVALDQPTIERFDYTVVARCTPTPDDSSPAARAMLAHALFLGADGEISAASLQRVRAFTAQGGQFGAQAQPDCLILEVSGPPAAAEMGLALLTDALLQPPLSDQVLTELPVPPAGPPVDADQALLANLLFESGQALYPGRFLRPATPSQAAPPPEDVRAEYAACFRGARVVAVTVVPAGAAEAASRLREVLGRLPSAEPSSAPGPGAPGDTVSDHVRSLLGVSGPAREVPLGCRSRVVEDERSPLAVIALGYAAPPLGTEGRACMQLAHALLNGPDGHLAHDPQVRQFALAAGTMLLGDGDDSRLVVYAACPRPWDVERLRRALAASVAGLARVDPLEPTLEAARARLLGGSALEVRTAPGRAYAIARCALAGGDVAGLVNAPLQPLRAVTPESFRAFVGDRLQPEQAAVAVSLPRLSYVGGSVGVSGRGR